MTTIIISGITAAIGYLYAQTRYEDKIMGLQKVIDGQDEVIKELS